MASIIVRRAAASMRCWWISITRRESCCIRATPRCTRRRGLPGLPAICNPGGVFALWSNDPPDDAFERVLAGAFATSAAHVVTFDNLRGDHDASNTVYVAVKADLPDPGQSSKRRRYRLIAARTCGRGPQLAPANRPCNADALTNKTSAGRSCPAYPGLKRARHRVGPFGDFQNEIQTYRRAAFCRRDVGCAGGRGVGPGQDRQDRRDLSLERQRRQRRRAWQGGDRNRGRDHQQRQSRARQSAADQECRPQGPRRRQGRGGVRRQSGQPRGRAEPGASPDHRRKGGGADRRLSVRHHADRERDRREIRHPLCQRRVGCGQPDRARLQMVLPRRRRWRRISPKSISTSSRT